jgi:hypothetical protein
MSLSALSKHLPELLTAKPRVQSRKAKTLIRSVAIELWKGGVSIAMSMAAVGICFEELKEETRAGKGFDTVYECFFIGTCTGDVSAGECKQQCWQV